MERWVALAATPCSHTAESGTTGCGTSANTGAGQSRLRETSNRLVAGILLAVSRQPRGERADVGDVFEVIDLVGDGRRVVAREGWHRTAQELLAKR